MKENGTCRMKTREERGCSGTVQRQCMLNDIKESQLEGGRREGNLAGQGNSLKSSGNNMAS